MDNEEIKMAKRNLISVLVFLCLIISATIGKSNSQKGAEITINLPNSLLSQTSNEDDDREAPQWIKQLSANPTQCGYGRNQNWRS
jgi:hypothetical protein